MVAQLAMVLRLRGHEQLLQTGVPLVLLMLKLRMLLLHLLLLWLLRLLLLLLLHLVHVHLLHLLLVSVQLDTAVARCETLVLAILAPVSYKNTQSKSR